MKPHVYIVVAVNRDTGEPDLDVGLWALASYGKAVESVKALNQVDSWMFPKHYAMVLGRYEFAEGPLQPGRKKS